jgi:hypothetical protein
MNRVPKPNQTSLPAPPTDPIVSDISVARLIDDGLLAIHREMKNLLMLGSRGKLDAANSRDLRDTVKLLFELKDRENDSLKGLTDDQLKELVSKALIDTKKE